MNETEKQRDILITQLGSHLFAQLDGQQVAFALVTAVPMNDGHGTRIGIQSNINTEEIVALLERQASGLRERFGIHRDQTAGYA